MNGQIRAYIFDMDGTTARTTSRRGASSRRSTDMNSSRARSFGLMRRSLSPSLEREFRLGEDLMLTLFSEAVWGDERRFESRYGETPDNRFLGGAFISMMNGVKLEWFITDSWSVWFGVREFTTIDPQARRCENRRTEYWRVPDATLFAIGTGYRF